MRHEESRVFKDKLKGVAYMMANIDENPVKKDTREDLVDMKFMIISYSSAPYISS